MSEGEPTGGVKLFDGMPPRINGAANPVITDEPLERMGIPKPQGEVKDGMTGVSQEDFDAVFREMMDRSVRRAARFGLWQEYRVQERPGQDHLTRIADNLGCSVGDLVVEEGYESEGGKFFRIRKLDGTYVETDVQPTQDPAYRASIEDPAVWEALFADEPHDSERQFLLFVADPKAGVNAGFDAYGQRGEHAYAQINPPGVVVTAQFQILRKDQAEE